MVVVRVVIAAILPPFSPREYKDLFEQKYLNAKDIFP